MVYATITYVNQSSVHSEEGLRRTGWKLHIRHFIMRCSIMVIIPDSKSGELSSNLSAAAICGRGVIGSTPASKTGRFRFES